MKTRFKAVIFDMDGTLTVPSLDFALIRREIGLPEGDIVSSLKSWPKAKSARAWRIIEAHELRAMKEAKLQRGAKKTLAKLKAAGARLGLLTRNSTASADAFATVFKIHFDVIVSRDFPHVKPSPEPVLHMLREWQIDPGHALVVGDYVDDITCGRSAGAMTCFFINPGKQSYACSADFAVASFAELEKIIFTPMN
jgi:HAD superfamily hydrolase (TIGR01549 family)